MTWFVRFSERAAKCSKCSTRVEAYDPRVDWEDDQDTEKDVDWRHLRFCLRCGIQELELSEKNVVQRLAQARRIWDQTAVRFGHRKLRKKPAPKPKSINCLAPKCKSQAIEILAVPKQGKVYMCDNKHTFFVPKGAKA